MVGGSTEDAEVRYHLDMFLEQNGYDDWYNSLPSEDKVTLYNGFFNQVKKHTAPSHLTEHQRYLYSMGYDFAEEHFGMDREENIGYLPPATDNEEMNGAGWWSDLKNWFTKKAMKLHPLTSWISTDDNNVPQREYRHDAEKFRRYGGSYLRAEREY